jgi:hypothetical protein
LHTNYTSICEDLRLLREAAVPLDIFGARAHNFQTHPPLSEEAVRQFEAEHRVSLPPEYRGFLIHVGNGGAGPAYGLFKLGEMDDGWGHAPWNEGGGFIGVLSQPFPHTEPWNDLSGEPEDDEAREDDPAWEEEYQRQMDAFEAVYWSPANVNGAIPICHLGCACRQWLVVTGLEAGHVWCDDRTDHGGLYPLQKSGLKRLTFLQWYRSWLDEALRKLQAAGNS